MEQLLELRNRLYLHDEIPESALDENPTPSAGRVSRGITRRNALVIGGVGAAALAGGGIWLWSQGRKEPEAPAVTTPEASPSLNPSPQLEGIGTLTEPNVLQSSDGLLELTLVAALTDVVVAGRQVRALTFNGSLPGPTLRIRPGDRIALTFHSELDAPTNLHTHGLVRLARGQQRQRVPPDRAGRHVRLRLRAR